MKVTMAQSNETRGVFEFRVSQDKVFLLLIVGNGEVWLRVRRIYERNKRRRTYKAEHRSPHLLREGASEVRGDDMLGRTKVHDAL